MVRRSDVLDQNFQQTIKQTMAVPGMANPISTHIRHQASPLISFGDDIRTVQGLLGKDVSTIMIYTPELSRDGQGEWEAA